MDANSISSNKITLKISTPQGREMTLNKGEVLQAQVQETGEEGSVTIVVKGKPIEAYSEVAVKPGQQLLLIVDDVRNGKTYLKVVTPEMMGKIENVNITANLLDMGIAAREDNIVLSRKLLQHNLPVNQINLNELSRNVSALGGMNVRNLEVAAFALTQGITGKNALAALAQFLSSPGDTAKLIPVLDRLLNALNSQSNTEVANQSAGSKNTLSSLIASESGSNQISAQEVPSNSSKTTEPLITGNKPDVVLGNNADQTSQVGQAGLEGEETSSGLKLIPTGVSAENSEVGTRSQTTLSSGDKPANVTVKGEFVIEQSNSGNEKIFTEKPAGSGNDNPKISAMIEAPTTSKPNVDLLAKNNLSAPLADGDDNATPAKTINQAGNTATAETQHQDDSPASINKANASADSKIKPELVVSEFELTTGTKVEEQLSGIRATKTIPASTEDIMPGPAVIANENETIERVLGREESSATKTVGTEPVLSRDTLKMEVLKLLDVMRSLMEIDPEAAPDEIAGKLQGASNSEKDIIRALSMLVDMAKNQDIAKMIPELKDFSLSLERLEKEISGQQLFNVTSRNAADNMSTFYYFAFPVKIDQEYSLCQLKINKDGRKSLKDVDKISLVVSLNTSKLGVVLFHIYWQRVGKLQVQGVVENQASCNYLNQNIGNLISKLEELGYKVKNLGVKVSSSAEELRIRPVLQEVSERLRPLGIDVTV